MAIQKCNNVYPNDTNCADFYEFCGSGFRQGQGNKADHSCLEESTSIFDGV